MTSKESPNPIISRRNFLTEVPVKGAGVVLGLKAFFASAASVVLSACEKGEEKAVSKLPDEGDFPECGKGIKFEGVTELGQPRLVGQLDTTELEFSCAYDKFKGRDCDPIRKEGLRRIEEIPDLFVCDKESKPKLNISIDIDNYGNLNNVRGAEGNCDNVIQDFSRRIYNVLERLRCKNGKPYEDASGWGRAPGGRYHSPCHGGPC